MRRMHLLVGGLMVWTSVAGAQGVTTIAGRPVFVWRPASAPSAPLVIFSHAFNTCGTEAGFLAEALAARGYFVIAPNHRDAQCAGGAGGGGGRGLGTGRGAQGMQGRMMEPFRIARDWSDTTFADRRADIVAILDAMRADTVYSNHVYFTQIVLAGHSLGGYTALGMAGGWPAWKLANVKAVLALSPYAVPFSMHNTLAGISAPVMYQGGTADLLITPSLRAVGGAYESSRAPKYFVELEDANHLAWTQRADRYHKIIVDYSVAFLDYYVRGVGNLDPLHRKASLVSDLKYVDR